MIFYGWSESIINTKQDDLINCPECNEKGLEVFQFSKYVHLYWIPIFPVSKRTTAACNNCDAGFEGNVLKSTEMQRQFRMANVRGGHPFTSFIGLIIILIGISAIWYTGSQNQEFEELKQTEEVNENFFTDGVGKFIDEEEHGIWYWNDNAGTKRIEGEYVYGKEEGVWTHWDKEGNLIGEVTYKDGMLNGLSTGFYTNGNIYNKTEYFENRMDGLYESWHEDGLRLSKGFYNKSYPDSLWTFWYENGKIQQEGKYTDAGESGKWNYWYSNGQKKMETEYTEDKQILIWNYWNEDGTQMVVNGNGQYSTFDTTGQMLTNGTISDGQESGKWTYYYNSGEIQMESHYENKTFLVDNHWSPEGEKLVVDGNGIAKSYYDGGGVYEQGDYINGLKTGTWIIWYENNLKMREENYLEGELNGEASFWYESGNLYIIGSYKDGLRSGIWKWWWEIGEKETEVNFVKGLKEGAQVFWSDTGKKIKEEHYKKGKSVEI